MTMTIVYIVTRHETYYPRPNVHIVEIAYADAPHLWAYHKYATDYYNTRRVEGVPEKPIGIYATAMITLPPFTRSHRITLGCADTLNATTKLAILLVSEDGEKARAAMEASEQNWVVRQRWSDFDR
jgi:hypothetical protein